VTRERRLRPVRQKCHDDGAAESAEGWKLPLAIPRRPAAIDPQRPMTETAWASAMQRKAAGRLRNFSENQSHKFGCRSAVGRVRRQSTHGSRSMRSEAVGRPTRLLPVPHLLSSRSWPAAGTHSYLQSVRWRNRVASGLPVLRRTRCIRPASSTFSNRLPSRASNGSFPLRAPTAPWS